MAIEGASLAEAARTFCDHFNSVLCRTITQARLQPIIVTGDLSVTLSFRRQGRIATASLETRYGRLELYLLQWCSSVEKNGRHVLRTERYRYALSLSPELEPLFRWEYLRTPESGNQHPRHHVHLDTVINIHDHALALKDFHISTGYVPFEEVIRFCIVELGTPPLKGYWEKVLEQSYQNFKPEFAR